MRHGKMNSLSLALGRKLWAITILDVRKRMHGNGWAPVKYYTDYAMHTVEDATTVFQAKTLAIAHSIRLTGWPENQIKAAVQEFVALAGLDPKVRKKQVNAITKVLVARNTNFRNNP